jgi:hypothetical protein
VLPEVVLLNTQANPEAGRKHECLSSLIIYSDLSLAGMSYSITTFNVFVSNAKADTAR